jgi:hypothetical protein
MALTDKHFKEKGFSKQTRKLLILADVEDL